MPVRPDHFCTPAELFGDDLATAVKHLRNLSGFDPLHSPEFWERWVSTQLGGTKTPAGDPVDVEVEIGGSAYRGEVKYSQAFWANFKPIRGKLYSRHVWKWVLSPRQHRDRAAHVVILIGVDVDHNIYFYVVPNSALRKGRTITITAASSRTGKQIGRLDHWIVPPTELLPAFSAAASYELAHRAETLIEDQEDQEAA